VLDPMERHLPWLALYHTPFRDSGSEASIRVPRMFHSHVSQQYDKQIPCSVIQVLISYIMALGSKKITSMQWQTRCEMSVHSRRPEERPT
jgi:hypothetical protein